jgi:large subunit ribosomal protein L17
MRHRRRSRRLGRSSSHRRALLKNLASALFLTHREYYLDEYGDDFDTLSRELPRRRLWVLSVLDNPPRRRGRIVTTLQKAKEVRPLIEKCVTIAVKSLDAKYQSDEVSEEISKKDNPEQWQEWVTVRAPYVTARRHCLKLLGDKTAVDVLFDYVAPEIMKQQRPGGYTRIVRLPTPRLGDAGTQAILEFVGFDVDCDRSTGNQEAIMPEFDDDVVGGGETEDLGTSDAGSGDAGAYGAGSDDAGSDDAGSDDAGSDDVGSDDAGSGDAGAYGAGSDDAGSDDAGSDDAGSGDAGSGDTGAYDAGSGDAGSDGDAEDV